MRAATCQQMRRVHSTDVLCHAQHLCPTVWSAVPQFPASFQQILVVTHLSLCQFLASEFADNGQATFLKLEVLFLSFRKQRQHFTFELFNQPFVVRRMFCIQLSFSSEDTVVFSQFDFSH